MSSRTTLLAGLKGLLSSKGYISDEQCRQAQMCFSKMGDRAPSRNAPVPRFSENPSEAHTAVNSAYEELCRVFGNRERETQDMTSATAALNISAADEHVAHLQRFFPGCDILVLVLALRTVEMGYSVAPEGAFRDSLNKISLRGKTDVYERFLFMALTSNIPPDKSNSGCRTERGLLWAISVHMLVSVLISPEPEDILRANATLLDLARGCSMYKATTYFTDNFSITYWLTCGPHPDTPMEQELCDLLRALCASLDAMLVLSGSGSTGCADDGAEYETRPVVTQEQEQRGAARAGTALE